MAVELASLWALSRGLTDKLGRFSELEGLCSGFLEERTNRSLVEDFDAVKPSKQPPMARLGLLGNRFTNNHC